MKKQQKHQQTSSERVWSFQARSAGAAEKPMDKKADKKDKKDKKADKRPKVIKDKKEKKLKRSAYGDEEEEEEIRVDDDNEDDDDEEDHRPFPWSKRGGGGGASGSGGYATDDRGLVCIFGFKKYAFSQFPVKLSDSNQLVQDFFHKQ